MSKSYKIFSFILSLAILISGVFVGGMLSSAEGLSLYQAVNTYDDAGVTFADADNNGTLVNDAHLISVFKARVTATDSEQGNAMKFTKAEPQTDVWRSAALIYDAGTTNLNCTKMTANTTYEISLKYKVTATPSGAVTLQLFNAPYQSGTDLNYRSGGAATSFSDTTNIIADLVTVTDATDGWVELKKTFTTGENHQSYFILSTVGSWLSGVEFWIDDVVLSECGNITVHGYGEEAEKQVQVTASTTVGELPVPELSGALFEGTYADADYTTPLSKDAKAADYLNIYYKWREIGYGEYYVGFESYGELTNVKSLGEGAVITTDTAYAGNSSLKSVLDAGALSAFELRDAESIEVKADNSYRIALKYKSDKDIKLYAGLGVSSNVPATAYAKSSAISLTAADAWTDATITFTADKGLVDGFSLALLMSADENATVYIDDVFVTDITAKNTVSGLSFDFSNDWYPAIEPLTYWSGEVSESAPVDSDEDGVYEINSAEELAYIIKVSGGEGKAYKLTTDIYLNDITKINWQTGAVDDGYDVKSWYTYYTATDFYGTIDGDGYVVYGLYINDGKTSFVSGPYGAALIPQVAANKQLAITELGMENAFVSYEGSASAFVGDLLAGATYSVERSYVGRYVTLTGANAGAFAAYTANGSTVTLSDSFSLAVTTDKTGYIGGLAGSPRKDNTPTTVTNCFNANGSVFSNYYTPGLSASNCYQTTDKKLIDGVTQISAENMRGSDVFTNASKMPSLNANSVFTATEAEPVLSVFVRATAKSELWSGEVSESAPVDSDGDGVYEINSAEELAYIIKVSGGEGKAYKLTTDIYLNDISQINWQTGAVADGYIVKSWYTYYGTADFYGTIDGDNHTVYGLYKNDGKTTFTANGTYGAALIPQAAEGQTVTIKNLGIDKAYINYDGSASVFVGDLLANANYIVDRSYAGSDVTITGASTGVFAAYAKAESTVTLSNSYSLATVTNKLDQYVGGLVGTPRGNHTPTTVTNCFNANGSVFSSYYTADRSASNCYQTADNNILTGVTKLSAENMRGSDVFTNASKMPNLNSDNAFKVAERDFSEYAYYTYLPEGTVLGGEYAPTFYDAFIYEKLAPLDSEEVLFGNVMTKSAYVRFATVPDAQDILVPDAKADTVVQGAAAEVLLNREYFDIEFDVVSENLESQNEAAVNYIFITDIHYPGDYAAQKAALLRQMELICAKASADSNIDFVVVGGDIVHGYYIDKAKHFEAIQEILAPLKTCSKPVIVAAGNHDDNCYGEFTTEEKAANVTSNLDWNKEVIDYIVKPTTNNGIVQDKDYNNENYNSKYYYYDLDAKNTRVICLDSSNYPHSYDDEGNITLRLSDGYTVDSAESVNKYVCGYTYYGYSAAQLKWLANEALNAPDGWNYIFVSHMGIDEETNGVGAVVNYGAELREIIKAYQLKTAYTNENLGISVDWTAEDGRIMSYQYGHVHYEEAVYSEDIDLWQFSSATAQSKNDLSNTDDEACFDIVSVTEGHIAKQNIGRGENAILVSNAPESSNDMNNDFAVDIRDLVKLSRIDKGEDLPDVRSQNVTFKDIRLEILANN